MKKFSIFLYRHPGEDGKDLNPTITNHDSIEDYNADLDGSMVVTHQIKIEGPGADLLNAAIALTYDTQEVAESLECIVKSAMAIKPA